MSFSEPDDLGSKLYAIISRLSNESGDPAEIAILRKAAARIDALEDMLRSLMELMDDTPYPDLHPAIRRARELLDE